VNRSARFDIPVMVALLAIVVLGGWWGLADGITSDHEPLPRAPHFISAPPRYVPPDTIEYEPGLPPATTGPP